MIIKSVKMKHFGRFSEKDIEFSEGLNIVEGENEAGKTTLHAFIRGMLFGIDKQRGRIGKNDVYSRYLPWDTPGAYQGTLDFEHEGRNIRISRVFLQNARNCSVSDTDTGEQIEWSDAGIASLIPELTPSAFDNTVSCAQTQLQSKEDFSGHIRSYIANMAGARDSKVDVSGALGTLEERIRSVQKKIKDIDEEGLEAEYKSLLSDEKDEGYIIEDRDKLLAEIEALEKESSDAPGEDEREKLKKKLDETGKLLEKLHFFEEADRDVSIALTKADELDKRIKTCDERLEGLKNEKEGASSVCDGLSEKIREMTGTCVTEEGMPITQEEADAARQQALDARKAADEAASEFENRRRSAGNLLIASLIMAAAGTVMAVAASDRIRILVIAGVLLLLSGLITMFFALIASRERNKLKEISDSASETALKADTRADGMQEILSKNRSELDGLKEQMQEAQLLLKDKSGEFGKIEAERQSLIERKDELIESIAGRKRKTEEERDRVISALREYGIEKGSDDPEKIRAELSDRLFRLEKEAGQREKAVMEKKTELARIEGELSRYGDIGARIDEAEKKLNEAKKEKEELLKELEALKLASERIESIAKELKGGFDRHINDALSTACGQVTAGKYKKAVLNADCEIELLGDNGPIPRNNLSTGTLEQLFLAFRLAMARLMFGDKQIPMFFDEVFAYYDDERLKSALEALSAIKDRQIILFACSKREREMLDSIGAAYNVIRL